VLPVVNEKLEIYVYLGKLQMSIQYMFATKLCGNFNTPSITYLDPLVGSIGASISLLY
jgi:hypothetical protein